MKDDNQTPKDRPYRANVKFCVLVVGIVAVVIVMMYASAGLVGT